MVNDTQVLAQFEAALERALATHELAPNLREAMKYSALGGGKRVRPMLVLRSAEAVGGPAADAMPAAVALEMVHCFSLVHDDLPALDNDDLRRGRPTAHKAHGEAMAILAGDALLSVALEVALASPREAAAVARELAAATTAMITGQVYDSLGGMPESLAPDAKLRLIHRNKTGALIRCACRMGALCAGASTRDLAALTTYGDAMGLMFQVVDDILDETQSTEHLGKSAGKDREAGKMTYPAVHGIERSRATVAELQASALASLSHLTAAAEPLRALADALAVRTR